MVLHNESYVINDNSKDLATADNVASGLNPEASYGVKGWVPPRMNTIESGIKLYNRME